MLSSRVLNIVQPVFKRKAPAIGLVMTGASLCLTMAQTGTVLFAALALLGSDVKEDGEQEHEALNGLLPVGVNTED